MQNTKNDTFINPIHYIKANVPAIVWEYFLDRIHDSIKNLKLTESRSASFRITVTNYADGLRRHESMFQVRPLLKQVLISVWGIENPHAFFEADAPDMKSSAASIASKLIESFESEYSTQLSQITPAA
jgi:hypothetical protein